MEETKTYPINRFLREVAASAARDDRGTLAELRRGLSATTGDRAWEHLMPYCSDFDRNEVHRAVWCTLGGLAALLIPDGLSASGSRHNLGTTMRALAKGTGDDESKALKSFEPKFRRLLSCGDTLTLCEMVAGIGRAAAAKGVPVNLESLFWDLWSWEDPDKREETRLHWAKQYFRVFETRPGDPAAEGEAAP